MIILCMFYGGCGSFGGGEVSDWKEAEEFAEKDLLEAMGFTNIQHLSKKDAIFPFDFLAERYDQKCLIDVTLRTRKPVKTKRLSTWRALGYKTMLIAILPERMMSILIELEESDSDNWVNITLNLIQDLEKTLKLYLTPSNDLRRFQGNGNYEEEVSRIARTLKIEPNQVNQVLSSLRKKRTIYNVVDEISFKIGLYNSFIETVEKATSGGLKN